MVTLPNAIPTKFNQGADQVVAGQISVASILLNVPLPSNPAVLPGCGLGMNNGTVMQVLRSDVNGLILGHGADPTAQVDSLVYTGQPTADDTISVNGNTITWKTSAVNPGEVTISVTDAATSYDNLAAEINGNPGTYGCSASNVGSAANGTCTLTALVAGTGFGTTTESTGNMTITHTAANAAGVKAYTLVDLEGFCHEDTYLEVEVPITYNGSTRSIHVNARITSESSGAVTKGSSTAGTYLTGLKDSFDLAIAGSNPTDDLPCHSSNVNDSVGDIENILKVYFATGGWTVTSNQLKIEAGVAGAKGNNIKIYTRTLPSFPSPLPDIYQNGIPKFDEGEVLHAGVQDDSATDATVATVEIKGSNAYGPINIITSDITDVSKIKLFITRNPEFVRALVRSGAVTYDPTRNIFMSTNEASNVRIGLFISFKSKDIKGSFDCLWVYDAIIDGAITQETSLRGVAGYTVTFKMQQDLERSGDPRYIRWNTRKLAA